MFLFFCFFFYLQGRVRYVYLSFKLDLTLDRDKRQAADKGGGHGSPTFSDILIDYLQMWHKIKYMYIYIAAPWKKIFRVTTESRFALKETIYLRECNCREPKHSPLLNKVLLVVHDKWIPRSYENRTLQICVRLGLNP